MRYISAGDTCAAVPLMRVCTSARRAGMFLVSCTNSRAAACHNHRCAAVCDANQHHAGIAARQPVVERILGGMGRCMAGAARARMTMTSSSDAGACFISTVSISAACVQSVNSCIRASSTATVSGATARDMSICASDRRAGECCFRPRPAPVRPLHTPVHRRRVAAPPSVQQAGALAGVSV